MNSRAGKAVAAELRSGGLPAEAVLLGPYLRRLLRQRASAVTRFAERGA